MKENMEVRVYIPGTTGKALPTLFREMFRDLWSSRDLAMRLAQRDIKGMYRQSLLGIVWAFITPLMNALVWIFLNGTGVVKLANTPIPYPVYVFTGTMLWAIFSESITAPLSQTQQAKSILGKINFPKEGLLLSAFYKLSFNSAIKTMLLLVVVVSFGIYPDWRVILFPVALLSIMFFGFVLGLFLTPLGMLYNDIGRAIPIALQLLMYLSPVIYIIPEGGILNRIMNLNPVTPLLVSARNWLTGFSVHNPGYFMTVIGVSLLLFLFGWLFYRISIPIIVERSSQ